ALSVLAAIPMIWLFALTGTTRLPQPWYLAAIIVGLGIVPLVLCLRMTILLPAIALDAPGANSTNAYHDTKVHTWGIFILFVAAFLVFVVLAVLFSLAAWLVAFIGTGVVARLAISAYSVTGMLIAAAYVAIENALYVMSVTVFAALSSRLYQLLGNHVN